jgi:hypothetical protein
VSYLPPSVQAAVNMIAAMLDDYTLANPGLLMHPAQMARLHGLVVPVPDSDCGQDEPMVPGVLTDHGREIMALAKPVADEQDGA